jgi:glutathione S-transferase
MDPPPLWHIPLSHFNEKVRWTLDYKRIPHRRQVLGADYLIRAWRATGRGTLPILFLDGRAIGDSTHIIAALEERYPEPPLFPVTPPRCTARSHWKTISTSSSARRCARPSSRRSSGTIRTSLCAC